jgi:A/G-specific adenine glycosylase
MSAAPLDALLDQAWRLTPDLADRLVAWQRVAGRHHLPWQQTRDPYRVWLSEIMLQQTQVSTVLGYYDRFLSRFPTVVDLADADLDEVLTLWSGLGYYSRARNLHRCAQAVRDLHGGRFPETAEQLQTLPGIGPSTSAAVAAFCFGERTSILDGNVRRVLSRALGWGEDLSVKANERSLWQAAQCLLPASPADMSAYTQGLMDLGATLCTPRKPACPSCPWSELCVARLQGEPDRYPVKTSKLKRSRRESWCLWLQHADEVWLVQRPHRGIWSGLWTLPMFDSLEGLRQAHPGPTETQPPVTHVLTHLDWRLHLERVVTHGSVVAGAGSRPDTAGLLAAVSEPVMGEGQWVRLDQLDRLGLPKPFQRWLRPD